MDATQFQRLTVYTAELELEVNRLRRRDKYLQQQAQDYLLQIVQTCLRADEPVKSAESTAMIHRVCNQLDELFRDVAEPGKHHAAFDHASKIAVRPLAEYVFRWQQRLSGADSAVIRLNLDSEHIIWFPARLHHILDNLLSNALRYRDPSKGEVRVGLSLRCCQDGYELQFTDNGLGIPDAQAMGRLELSYRAAPTRTGALGVGLAVVKFIVEQCCGTLAIASTPGQGTCITVVLPRYDMEDYVDQSRRGAGVER